jgi:hypothetical protein
MNFNSPPSGRSGPRQIPAIACLIVIIVVSSTASATGVGGLVVKASTTDSAKVIHSLSAVGSNELASARASLSDPHHALAEVTPAGNTTPSLRASANMVWDARDGYVLLFGGCALSAEYICGGPDLNDTWEYVGGTWNELSPPESPPAMGGSSMTYDSTEGVVLLFGGQLAAQQTPTNPAYDNLTWMFSNGDWTNVTTVQSPAPRVDAAFVNDPSRGGAVLYGGLHDYLVNTSNGTRVFGVPESDTWVYSNGTWTNVTAQVGPSPPGLESAGATFDPGVSGPFLFGGYTNNGGISNGTWILGGGGWINLTLSIGPPANVGESLVYDSSAGDVLMFGGVGRYGEPSNLTWEYSNGSWTEVTPNVVPIGTFDASLADDPPAGGPLLVMGATQRTYEANTQFWSFINGDWTIAGDNLSTPPAGAASMVFDSSDGYVLLVSPGILGASQATESTWTYHAGTWTQVNSIVEPLSRVDPALVYDAADGYVLLYGGQTPSGGFGLNDTWMYHAGKWTGLFPSRAPPSSGGGAIAYDAATGYVVYLTSTDTGFQTWKWIAGNWTNLNIPLTWIASGEGAPYPEMVYDTAAGYPLLIGGSTTTCPGGIASCLVTWTLVNGSWIDVTNSSMRAPPPLNGTSLTYDFADNEVLLFGGYCSTSGCPSSAFSNETWEFSAGQWIGVNATGPPEPRSEAAIAFDNTSGSVILFGGLGPTPTGTTLLADTWSFLGNDWTQTLPALSANLTSVDVGVSTVFNAVSSAIFGSPSFSYSGLPGGCSSQNTANLSCTPTASGSFVVSVKVQYTGAAPSTAWTDFTVVSLPRISQFSASENPLNLTATATLSVAVSGGTPPLTFAYSNLPPGCESASSASIGCKPTQTGNFTISVEVTDHFGRSDNASLLLTVGTTHEVTPPGQKGGGTTPWLSTPTGRIVATFLVILVVAALLLLSIFLVRGRRMRREGEELIEDVREAVSDGSYTRNRPP